MTSTDDQVNKTVVSLYTYHAKVVHISDQMDQTAGIP